MINNNIKILTLCRFAEIILLFPLISCHGSKILNLLMSLVDNKLLLLFLLNYKFNGLVIKKKKKLQFLSPGKFI